MGVFVLPLMWCKSMIHKDTIYTPGQRKGLQELTVLPKNTAQWPQPGLKPGLLNQESSALTMRPKRFHLSYTLKDRSWNFFKVVVTIEMKATFHFMIN